MDERIPHLTNAAALIVAAGRGTRMGRLDKCALLLNGRSLLSYSVATFAALVDTVIVVAPDRVASWKTTAATEGWPSHTPIVAGGETRQDSVRAGLDALTGGTTADVIAIHDGARPLVTAELVQRCLEQGYAVGAASAATPVTDTIKRAEEDLIIETLDRSTLWAAQTPQVFRVDVLRRAFAWAESRGLPPFTDEAGLVEAFGHPVAIVRGDRSNIKVTEPVDQIIAEALLRARKAVGHG